MTRNSHYLHPQKSSHSSPSISSNTQIELQQQTGCDSSAGSNNSTSILPSLHVSHSQPLGLKQPIPARSRRSLKSLLTMMRGAERNSSPVTPHSSDGDYLRSNTEPDRQCDTTNQPVSNPETPLLRAISCSAPLVKAKWQIRWARLLRRPSSASDLMSGAVKTKEFLIHDGPGEDLSLVATDVENEECDRATSIASAMPTAAFDTVKFDEPVTSASYSTADTQSSLGHHGTLHHDNSDHQSTEYSEHANHGDTIDPEGFESNSNITFNSTDDNHCLDAVPGITALRRNGNKLFEAPRHPNKEEKPLLNSGNYSIKDSRQSVYRVVIPTPRQNQRRQQRYGKYTYARPTTRVSFIPWSERGYCMEYSNQDVPISSTLMDGQPYAENTDMVRAFSPNEVQQFAGGSNDEGEEEDWEDTTTDNDEQEPKIPTISQHHIHSRGARHRATVATYSSYSRRKNNIQRPSLRSVPRITESSCRFGPRCQAVVLARAHGKTSLGPVPPVQSHAQYEPLLSPPPQCSADHPMQPGVQDLPLWYGPRLDLPSLRELAQAAKSEQATSKANNTAL